MVSISDDVVIDWQEIVDIMAEIFNIPAALIMRLIGSEIEVFISSKSENNPYKSGDKEKVWGSGLYCENVLKTRKKLLVPDALNDENWKNNPDIKLGMVSYLGFPITLPDGKPFGTICILDIKKNSYSNRFERLMLKFKKLIENDLKILYEKEDLEIKNKKLSEAKKETEELFLKAFKNSPVMISISKIEDGTYIEINDTFVNCTGYTKDNAIGKTSVELGFISKEDRDFIKKSILTDGHIKNAEFDLSCSDGSIATCLYSGEVIEVGGIKRLLSIAIDITERKQQEKLLKQKQIDLEAHSKKLEDMNTALNVLIEHRGEEKENIKKNILMHFEKLVFPYFPSSINTKTNGELSTLLSIIERNVKEILLKGENKNLSLYAKLTPMESQIAQMIKNGKTSKEIAEDLKVSVHTIYFHRENIRKKFNLNQTDINLKTYLQSQSK